MDLDPLRLAARAAFAYLYLLVMIRMCGKTIVTQGSTADFVLALVFADLVDDAIWGEVPLLRFVSASGTLFAARLLAAAATVPRASSGAERD